MTRRFAEQVYRLTAITTNQEAGWFLGLDDENVYRIDLSILKEKALEKLTPIPSAAHLSVDEVSYKKYHNYLTNMIDVVRRLVIWNADGRTQKVLDQYYQGIGEIACKKIESVALDGAKTYISSTQKHATNALIVYDKFHIIQKLNNTIDEVRKMELRQARKVEDHELIQLTHCRQRFVLLKKTSRLSDKQKSTLDQLCKCNKPIFEGMLLKEQFLTIYDSKEVSKAEDILIDWIQQAKNSTLKPFNELAKSFESKKESIINWFRKKVTSAISEGFNNKIKRLKRMAYGYRNVDYFRLKIHQHCGLLNPKIAT